MKFFGEFFDYAVVKYKVFSTEIWRIVNFNLINFIRTKSKESDPGVLTIKLRYSPLNRVQVWRFVTYMFVHSNIWHLSFNVIFQLFLGIPIEMIHKWRVTIVYLSGVLMGCMGASIYNHNIYLVGASGGVYALITAHIANVILNWKQMRLGFVNLFICLVYCVADFATAILWVLLIISINIFFLISFFWSEIEIQLIVWVF